jgi:hypothetical protein
MAHQPHARFSFQQFRFGRMALLWLALVLGAAQAIAVAHVYTHARAEAPSQSAGKHAGGAAQCNSCILAATVGGGAPPAHSFLPVTFVGHPVPASVTVVALFALPPRPYAIRAPPALAA